MSYVIRMVVIVTSDLLLSPLGPSPYPRRTDTRNCTGRGNTIAALIILATEWLGYVPFQHRTIPDHRRHKV